MTIRPGWRRVRRGVGRWAAMAVVAVATVLAAFLVLARGAAAQAQTTPAPTDAGSQEASLGSRDALDRQTPRRTLQGFLREGSEGDFRVAANYLDLHQIPLARRDADGPDLAQKLAYVLERRPTLDLTKIPDIPEGKPDAKPPGTIVADTLYAGEDPVPIVLTRTRFADGVDRWLIAASTVDAIPSIDAAYGPRSIGVNIPRSLSRPTFLGNELWQWIGALLAAAIGYAAGRVAAAILVRSAMYFARRTLAKADDLLVESARRPLRLVIGALVFRGLLSPVQLTTAVVDAAEHVVYSALVVGVAWFVLRALGVATVWLDEQAGRDGSDMWRGRRMRTQANLLRRVASLTIGFVAAAFFLLQFEFVRSVGVSLLASAGVLGVVVGFAAQRSLAAIIGGIQFSVAQPVRMGDDVIVEGELGEVEELNLTFAVVRLWDKRRIILPITYFLEKPFQNWTRSGTDLIGSVFFKVEHGVSVAAIRQELERICASDPLWDRQACTLFMTDTDATVATLRAAVSAENADKLFVLGCNVREKLSAFIHAARRPDAAPAPDATTEAISPPTAPAPDTSRRPP